MTNRGSPPGGVEHDNEFGIGRRNYLKLGSTLLAGSALGGLASGTARASGVLADPAPSDQEVGGGATYDRHVSERSADYVVSTRDDLLAALDAARSGDVVYVADGASIDMGSTENVSVRDDVTLASGRGRDGSMGGLLYTDEYVDSMFKVRGDRVRFTGLRIRGPRSDYFTTSDYDRYGAKGVWLLGEDCEVDNCQLYGWPYAAVIVGARSYTNSVHVHHNSIHNNQLEGLGYGVDLLNGHSLVEHNYFDYNRHSVDGFGYETNGYEARYNLVGPHPISHAFDMHCLEENLGTGGNRAGGTIKIHHNTFEFTHDVFEREQEAITIRGEPADGVYVEQNWFRHAERPSDDDIAGNGQAYRQKNVGSTWRRMWATGNAFGDEEPASDVGCPRGTDWRPAQALSESEGSRRSDVAFDYRNRFDQELTVTDVSIDPRSSSVARLADGSKAEGRWAAEIHIAADRQDGCCDVGGGLDLPGSIDLSRDGHSQSPDTEAVLSADSTASVALSRFCDGNDRPLDMHEEVLHFAVSYELADGTTGTDEFSTLPVGQGSLDYNGDAAAVSNGERARSGVEFGVRNNFGERLTVTDVRIDPASSRVAKLADHSYGETRWESEIHVAADVQDGCCDVGGGLDLPGSIDLSRDGHSQSPDTEAVLSEGSDASVALWRFEDADGNPVDMAGERLTVEVSYRLDSGTTGSATFTVDPEGQGALQYNGDAKAVSNGERTRSGVEFGVRNWFDQELTVTDVGIAPASSRVAKLADHSYGETRWESEVHIAADRQDGCCDVGGGLDLPGSIDLSRDGHSQSPNTDAVLSAGSDASVALWRFEDADGNPVDMTGREVDVELAYRLDDGTTGAAAFTVEPSA